MTKTPPAPIAGRHDGRRVFITGAGSGIGQATAKRLAAEGATVACADLHGAGETAEEIGDAATAFDLDVTDFAAVEAAVNDFAEANGGGLDAAMPIAGIGHFANSHEETAEGFNKIVQVNLNGTFHVCRAALAIMVPQGSGTIVNCASNAGIRGQLWSAAYCASKGGVIMLTKALAREYISTGLRINAVAPGQTNTNIINSFVDIPEGGSYEQMTFMMSEFGSADPQDLAASFSYVASAEAQFMTGAVVSVDGGLTC